MLRMLSLHQPITPFITEMVDRPTEETTVFDVLMGTVAIVIGLAAVALVLGLVCAGVLIALRRIRGRDELEGGGSDATRLGLEPPTRERPQEPSLSSACNATRDAVSSDS